MKEFIVKVVLRLCGWVRFTRPDGSEAWQKRSGQITMTGSRDYALKHLLD